MMNVNLIRSEEAPGEDRTIIGDVGHRDAQVIDVLGVAKLNWTLVIDESYVLDGRTIPKLININCYAIDMDLQSGLTKGRRVKVSGRDRKSTRLNSSH